MNECVVTSVGTVILVASTEIVDPDKLMNAAAGVRVVTIGQIIVGWATCMSVRISNVCVVVALLGKLTCI